MIVIKTRYQYYIGYLILFSVIAGGCLAFIYIRNQFDRIKHYNYSDHSTLAPFPLSATIRYSFLNIYDKLKAECNVTIIFLMIKYILIYNRISKIILNNFLYTYL